MSFFVLLLQFALALTLSRLFERALLNLGKVVYQKFVLWAWFVITR